MYDEAYRRALKFAYNALNRRDYSVVEMRQKLQLKGFSDETIDGVIESLTRKGYLNDEEYAKSLVQHYQNVRKIGRIAIVANLQKKGIPRELAESVMSEYSIEAEENIIRRLIEQLAQRGEQKEKIINYLLRKGFIYDSVKSVLETFYQEINNNRNEELAP